MPETIEKYKFVFDPKLGIKIPHFQIDWEHFTQDEQTEIISLWEQERAKIPERIKQLEQEIHDLHRSMEDMDFAQYCEMHKEVISLASAINDLNIWYRTEAEIDSQ